MVMSQSPCQEAEARAYTGLPAAVLYILRSEALAVAALTVFLYGHSGASWWIFAALWLAPDLSMLGYLAGPFWGARIYNGIHAYTTPIVLGLCAFLLGARGLVPAALIWTNHIAIDRLLGYGLKYPSRFGWTHLGPIGKERRDATS
jgi:Domain of unknown function (DUF4260)